MKVTLLIFVAFALFVVVSCNEEEKKRSSPKFDRIIQMLEKRREEAEGKLKEVRKGGNAERIEEEEKKLESLNQQLSMFKDKVQQTPGLAFKERKRNGMDGSISSKGQLH
eukprot:TRINITY_DN2_c0_g1_i5.p1 TRINITY_DN2_c0_g1~~TRINITY_DN2_c0_g1_i5.p1  ORF type:complete len:110 (-),score=57.44 TRINITY_DN2_c0_g1_i5:81-410(-)